MHHLIKKYIGFFTVGIGLFLFSSDIVSQSVTIYNEYLDPAKVSLKGLLVKK